MAEPIERRMQVMFASNEYRHTAIWVVLWLVLSSVFLHAQQEFPPYEGFRFDSTFYLGAHGILLPHIARNSLQLDFSQTYHGPVSLDEVLDPERWPTSSHPDSIARRWADSLSKRFYDAAYSLGLKVIYEPGNIPAIVDQSRAIETYVGVQSQEEGGFDSLHVYTFEYSREGAHDSIYNHHVWGITTPAADPPTDVVIAGGSRGTAWGLKQGGYYRQLGYADSSRYFDITITVKVDEIPSSMEDDTLLAYILLYRRQIVGQNGDPGCRCNFYTKFDSLPITRGIMVDGGFSPLDSGSGYREPTFTFEFPVDPPQVVASDLVIPGDGAATSTVLRASDIIENYHPPFGGWFGWGIDTISSHPCGRFCARLLDSLKGRGYIPKNTFSAPETIEEGDFYYDVHSTRRASITFLRGRISPHNLSLLRRGDLDPIIHADLDSLYADPVLDSLLMRIGVTGEEQLHSWIPSRIVSSKVQRYTFAKYPEKMRGMWNNTIGEHGSYRIFMGDLDTMDIRMMHMQASQAYHFGGPIPITYANPDSMSATAVNSYYEMAQYDRARTDSRNISITDTIRARFIMGNSPTDYSHYLRSTQEAFRKHRANMIDAADVARFRYDYLRNSPYPVWYVVQVHGWFGQNSSGYNGHFDNGWRPTTPEEITAQSWMTLNHGMDAINFSDFCFDGREFGVMHYITGDTTTEYGTLDAMHPVVHGPGWIVPKMWIGFGRRYNAVKSITDTFRMKILPVYTKLDRNGACFALHQTASFDSIPLLQTVRTERAHPDSIMFRPTGKYDPSSESYMEVTVFKPGSLAATEGNSTRYLLFTNLRCWPADFGRYNDTNIRLFDRVAPLDSALGYHCDTVGLGNIDVRRPVVVFRNISPVMADTFEVQRVGETTWRKVAAGDTLELDWLKPGWGAMYRVRPVPVPEFGTSYEIDHDPQE